MCKILRRTLLAATTAICAFSSNVFADIPYGVDDDNPYALKIIVHKDSDRQFSVAWLAKDETKTINISSYEWYNGKFNLTKSQKLGDLALDQIGGFTKDSAGNSYILTATKDNMKAIISELNENEALSEKKGAYRPNIVRIVKISADSQVSIIADLNSETYSANKIYNPIHGLTSGLAYSEGVRNLGAIFAHNWAWDTKVSPAIFHERSSFLGVGVDGKARYRDGGSTAHSFGTVIAPTENGIVAGDIWEGGVYVFSMEKSSNKVFEVTGHSGVRVPKTVLESLVNFKLDMDGTIEAGSQIRTDSVRNQVGALKGNTYTTPFEITFTADDLSTGQLHAIGTYRVGNGGGSFKFSPPKYDPNAYAAFNDYLKSSATVNTSASWGKPAGSYSLAAKDISFVRMDIPDGESYPMDYAGERRVFDSGTTKQGVKRMRFGGIGTGEHLIANDNNQEDTYIVTSFLYGDGHILSNDNDSGTNQNVYAVCNIPMEMHKGDYPDPSTPKGDLVQKQITDYPSGTSAYRLKMAKAPTPWPVINGVSSTGRQQWTLIWEKWVKGKYDSTWVQTIWNQCTQIPIGLTDASKKQGVTVDPMKVAGNPRIQEGGGAFYLHLDNRVSSTLAWVNGDPANGKLVLNTLDVANPWLDQKNVPKDANTDSFGIGIVSPTSLKTYELDIE